jgi:hypothetical protein
METVSCHPSGSKNFEVAPRFLEKLCTSAHVHICVSRCVYAWLSTHHGSAAVVHR